MKVAAVVVTYNREELLAQTLAGLEKQSRPVDHILVINNASTDGTKEMLDNYDFKVDHTVKHLNTNTGGAGGFSIGIETAYAMGYDAFWIMDDDTVPQKDALKFLVSDSDEYKNRHGEYPSFACSMVLWKDGSICEMNNPVTTWDWPRDMAKGAKYTLTKSCSFVSCMVMADAVEKVGLPYSQYFIWYDDAEYTQRLSKLRPGIFSPESKVDHLLAINHGVNYGDLNEDNYWKFSHGARNQVSAAISLRRPLIAMELLENMLKQWRGSGVSKKLRLKILGCVLKGLVFNPVKRFPAPREK